MILGSAAHFTIQSRSNYIDRVMFLAVDKRQPAAHACAASGKWPDYWSMSMVTTHVTQVPSVHGDAVAADISTEPTQIHLDVDLGDCTVRFEGVTSSEDAIARIEQHWHSRKHNGPPLLPAQIGDL